MRNSKQTLCYKTSSDLLKTQNKTARNNGADKSVNNSNGIYKLNMPMSKSEMSKADKATLKAWEYTYKNRDKRVD